MVNVGEKDDTKRIAIAKGSIIVSKEVYLAIKNGTSKKGDVLGISRIAGIMATKKTSDLIPLCHTINITKATIDFELIDDTNEVQVVCKVECIGKTGVEMEALVGVNISLLTIYDMCKAIDKSMTIKDVYLEKKSGGKSGLYERQGIER